jgi:hypothetical protein
LKSCFQVSFFKWRFEIFHLAEDFILESQVFSALLTYDELGGEADYANKLLADNYSGLSQMSNLFGCWLSSLESNEVGTRKNSIINVKELE